MKIINPATEEVLTEIQEDTPDTVKKKFEKSKLSQTCWRLSKLEDRISKISLFRELLISNLPVLAETLSKETGKPISQARNEIKATPDRIQFFIDHVRETLSAEEIAGAPAGMKERITYEPIGVVANISAWNYPYFVGSNVYIPALLAGNTVLYKPSEFATMTGLEVARLMKEAGIPEDVFTPIIGGGSVGASLLSHPLNGVFFTGSYATGVKIAQAAAASLPKLQLELGGKDPVYVCEDVDLKTAAEGIADGAFYNNGQSCCSVERIYVHNSVYTEFLKFFVETVRGFKLGDPLDEKNYLGPLTRKEQVAVLEKQVNDAVSKGAKLECGGKKISRPGYYFEPTVFSNVNHSMVLMRDESFGPIIGIQSVENDEEATKLMNDTAYGLTAGVYTKDAKRAEAILSQIQSGSVYWNCCDRVSPRLPWTGRGYSGVGSTLSWHGIMAFVQPKAWHLRG